MSPAALNQKTLCKLQMKTIENINRENSLSSLRLPFVADVTMIRDRKLANIHVKNFMLVVKCYRRSLLRRKCIDLS